MSPRPCHRCLTPSIAHASQHAQGDQGQGDHQAVGSWGSAAFPLHVGALLPRRARNRLRGGLGRPRQHCHVQERATRPPSEARTRGHTCTLPALDPYRDAWFLSFGSPLPYRPAAVSPWLTQRSVPCTLYPGSPRGPTPNVTTLNSWLSAALSPSSPRGLGIETRHRLYPVPCALLTQRPWDRDPPPPVPCTLRPAHPEALGSRPATAARRPRLSSSPEATNG